MENQENTYSSSLYLSRNNHPYRYSYPCNPYFSSFRRFSEEMDRIGQAGVALQKHKVVIWNINKIYTTTLYLHAAAPTVDKEFIEIIGNQVNKLAINLIHK